MSVCVCVCVLFQRAMGGRRCFDRCAPSRRSIRIRAIFLFHQLCSFFFVFRKLAAPFFFVDPSRVARRSRVVRSFFFIEKIFLCVCCFLPWMLSAVVGELFMKIEPHSWPIRLSAKVCPASGEGGDFFPATEGGITEFYRLYFPV